uniref:Vesicle transport v-SNARE N-terminal domain-containing protein n=1 Tax=Lygus hesperus TaxID=30085 RepID=A0A0A9YGR3_LYGHE
MCWPVACSCVYILTPYARTTCTRVHTNTHVHTLHTDVHLHDVRMSIRDLRCTCPVHTFVHVCRFVEEIEHLLARISKDDKQPLPDDVDRVVDELSEVLEQLKIEVHSIISVETRTQIAQKIRTFEQELASIKLRMMQGGASQTPLDDDERHEINMNRLRSAHSQLLESELVADDTLTRLHEQEDILRRTVANVRDTNTELNTSTRLLNRMNKWWRG